MRMGCIRPGIFNDIILALAARVPAHSTPTTDHVADKQGPHLFVRAVEDNETELVGEDRKGNEESTVILGRECEMRAVHQIDVSFLESRDRFGFSVNEDVCPSTGFAVDAEDVGKPWVREIRNRSGVGGKIDGPAPELLSRPGGKSRHSAQQAFGKSRQRPFDVSVFGGF
ncbi:hypothetical protein B0H17DRAFT_698533 [Mycena rosella]|uniref:Uncharacterized protein n=1 Tax=Mycena rosella TaxID=1033263 RepID=A0AAD7GTM2_MYCRO|nr:hypothetical protein B0H17DRAFT_698533 [Mycena rosella]